MSPIDNKQNREILLYIKIIYKFNSFLQAGINQTQAVRIIKNLLELDFNLEKILINDNHLKSNSASKTYMFLKNEFINDELKEEEETLKIKFQDLRSGNCLAENIEDIDGQILIPAGHEIQDDMIIALMKYRQHKKIKEPVTIYID